MSFGETESSMSLPSREDSAPPPKVSVRAYPCHPQRTASRLGRSCEQNEKMVDWFGLLQTDLPPMIATYLETLNREQRRAVGHGVQNAPSSMASRRRTQRPGQR